MVNIASIVKARNLPVMAEYGWSMLALFALSIGVFLVPVPMAAAELGTAWPHGGRRVRVRRGHPVAAHPTR
jgi:glutamate:GABA antiporter